MTREWDDTRKRSAKQLFGRALRVALAEWIVGRDGSPFYLQEAQDALHQAQGEANSAIAVELRRLVEYGMLLEMKEASRVFFIEQPSPLWQAFRAISEALDSHCEQPVRVEE